LDIQGFEIQLQEKAGFGGVLHVNSASFAGTCPRLLNQFDVNVIGGIQNRKVALDGIGYGVFFAELPLQVAK
jgi:hypothetical protein